MIYDWLIDLFIVLNATFSNISAIPWRPVLVVEEAGVPGENHRPWAGNCKLYHLRLRVECTLSCNLQKRVRTHAVLVIWLYELLGNPTTSLSHPDPPCRLKTIQRHICLKLKCCPWMNALWKRSYSKPVSHNIHCKCKRYLVWISCKSKCVYAENNEGGWMPYGVEIMQRQMCWH